MSNIVTLQVQKWNKRWEVLNICLASIYRSLSLNQLFTHKAKDNTYHLGLKNDATRRKY